MSSKTKIVVLHMKEIIYTVIFAVFGHYSDPAFDIHVPPGTSLRLKRQPDLYSGNLHLRYHSEQYCAGS